MLASVYKFAFLLILYFCIGLHAYGENYSMPADTIKISAANLRKIITGKQQQWIDVSAHQGKKLEDEINNSIQLKRKKRINISNWIIKNYSEKKDVINIYASSTQHSKSLVYVIPLNNLIIPYERKSALTNGQVKRMNTFNRLFGDYFSVNENMEIITSNSDENFNTFYTTLIKDKWCTDFQQNLDKDVILKSNFKNVFTMNLKFEEGGLFSETCLPEEKNNVFLKEKKKQLFLSDTIQKINIYYRKNYVNAMKKQMMKDGVLEKTTDTTINVDSLIDFKINETLKNTAYTAEYDLNGSYLKQLALEMLEKIKKHNIQHIYFFAHGYNVPHALAQMQGNRLLKEIHQLHDRREPILFVRIFWKGGDAKKLKIKTQQVDQHILLKKIIYKNKLRIRNARGFKDKTKEAIKCGHSLRRLLYLLEANNHNAPTYHLISHSLGAALVTHCLINDLLPIQYKRDELIKITKESHYQLDDIWRRRADSLMYSAPFTGFRSWFFRSKERDEALNYISFMRYNPLPNLKIIIFMNAPAIPGVPLFRFADVCKRYNFIVGHNIFDPILAKRFINKNQMISGKLSGFAGKTSLGLNYNNEVGQTEFLITTNKLKAQDFNFKGYKTSTFFEHDLFFYTQHPLFMDALKAFAIQ